MRRRTSTLEQPALVELGASGNWRLDRPWECSLPGGGLLLLPEGVVTDLASVPSWLQWIVDDDGLGAAAPLVHDVIYRHGGYLPPEWLAPYRRFSRREADDLLYLLAVLSGCPPWRARAAWVAVRIAAARCWRVA